MAVVNYDSELKRAGAHSTHGWRRLVFLAQRYMLGTFGLIIMVMFVWMAISADLICRFSPLSIDSAHRLASRGPIDLLFVPIGAYHPWIHAHCTPEEAVAMGDEAGARYLMPIHHQTFMLSWEPIKEPVQRFTAALHNAPERIALTQIGQTFELPGSAKST